MYCPSCGAYIPDGEEICPSCHADIKSGYQYNNNAYNQPYNPNSFSQQYSYDEEYEANKNKISNAKLLGILSIVLGIVMSPIVGIICAVIGLVNTNNINVINSIKLFEEKNKARKLNSVGIVIPIVIWVLGIFTALFIFGFINAASYY